MAHLALVHRSHTAAMNGEPHLSVEDLASLIDGLVSPDERARAEGHLAHCDECREELAASARAVASATAPPTRRLPWQLIVPLAAGIVVAVVLRTPGVSDQAGAARERAPSRPNDGIVTVFPPARTALHADALRFVWRPIDSSVGYRVIVKELSGAPVWSADVADTVLVLPDSVRLRVGESYVWRVDGERADGTTASSAETAFRLDRR